MINFTSMATGFQNRGDENRIERRKVAEAFEQFKQNNPEATLAQFQQYIDSVSGGRNYLAGGAGSGETLRKLAADNQAKKARRLAAEAQASKMARFKNERYIQEQLQDEIGNALISAKPTKPKEGPEGRLSGVQPKINYGRLAREFAENNPLVGEMGFDLSDLFTEQTRSQVMADYTEKNLPAVQTYITGLSAADLESVETDDIMRMYRLNPVIAEAVLKKAKGNLAEETELKVQELREQAGDHLRNLFSSGLLDETSNLDDAVRDRFKRHPNYAAAFLDPDGTMDVTMSNFTNSIQRSLDAIGAERDRKRELERGTRKSTVTANVMRLLQGESARAASNLKRPMGFDLEKRRLLTLAQSAMTDEFRDELTGSNTGTSDGMPSVGELDKIIESFLQGVAQEKVGNYQETTAAARIEAQTTAPLARQKAIDANIKVGTDAYGGTSVKDAAKTGGNPFGGDIAAILGKEFVMDPVTLGVIGKMLGTFMEGSGNNKTLKTGKDGAPLSALEMANEIADVLKTTNGVRGTGGLAARAEQLARAKVIGPDSLTFSQYEDRMAKSMGEAQDAVISEAELAYKDGLDGNLEAIDALKGLLREYTGETVPFYKSLTEAHRGTSKIWINNADERNSHWNQRRVDAMIGSLENGTVIETINKMIGEIQARSYEYKGMGKNPTPVAAAPVVEKAAPVQLNSFEELSKVLEGRGATGNASVDLSKAASQDAAAFVDAYQQMGERRRASDTFGGVDNIEAMRAKAEADGYAPPYSSMADDFERRDWREAFGRTHDALGKRIPTISEKFNSGVGDVKKLYETITSGTEGGPSQIEQNAENEAGIAQARSDLTRSAQTFSYLERDLQARTMLARIFNDENLNIVRPTNKQEAEYVVADLKELLKGSLADLGEDTYDVFNTRGNGEDVILIDEMIKQIMAPYQ